MKESISINGTEYVIEIHDERRKNTVVSIRRNIIRIRLNLGLSREERARQILKMKQWAQKKIEENPHKPKTAKSYTNGQVIQIGQENFTIRISEKEKAGSSARMAHNDIFLNISASLSPEHKGKHIRTLLSRIIAQKRLPNLKRKIDEINKKHFQVQVSKILFRNSSSLWGSCSSQGNINISTRLLFAPDDVLESVCVHELAHRIEHNHSDKFWAVVKRVMPNYDEKAQWLKENGDKCVF